MSTPSRSHTRLKVSNNTAVYKGFIKVNGRVVVDATFDLTHCPLEMVGDILHILSMSGMNLKKT